MSSESKFGISLDLVNLLFQEPNRNRYESKYYWDELFTLIPAAGFNSIEIPYLPMLDLTGRIGVPMSIATITAKYGSVMASMKSFASSSTHQSSLEAIWTTISARSTALWNQPSSSLPRPALARWQ
jgi:hypothetical protein